MSQSQTQTQAQASPEAFKVRTRRILTVFVVVMCVTAAMVATSFAPLGSTKLTIALILVAATVNACFVAVNLMHIMSERGIIVITLIFTAIFFVVLLGLTFWASHDIPAVATH